MEVYKIDITSWTASFRYPNLISGMQPTLEVPPISTILGLINAAAGFYVEHKNLTLGYYFEYETESEDLETIYQISSKDGKPTNDAKSNVITRKFLFNNYLRLYTTDKAIVDYFTQPYYQLVLGRMNDLATVTAISGKEDLEETSFSTQIRGQIIPFKYRLAGQLQALPKYFTNEFPRKNLGTEPFSIINYKSNIVGKDITTYRDILPNGKEVDVFFHQLNFAE
ncbi:type I-B CRISPR-associated protein Cas5b [Emticicia oligotrophica]|uniref:type I-B CRISPR-associated protein Cas5b n=1 Tax=Emticicia oligotrophica TaxID=312279 RepID=UPI00273B0478|nr:type I-B CRISPR-associated protein Cas5b [Emticicia oligotrophica]